MRAALIFTLGSALLACLWVFMQPVGDFSKPQRYRPEHSGSTFTFRTLRASERIVIVRRNYRRDETTERLYQVEGGQPSRIAVRTLRGAVEDEIAPPIAGVLTKDELHGLDAYLLFLRHGFSGGSHRLPDIVVGYYRDGTKIGEERFRDDTAMLWGFRIENGSVVVPDQNPEPFPIEVFREIIPPWIIEQRLKTPNKAPEPTPGLGTIHAAHGSRQVPSWLIFDVGQNMNIRRACVEDADVLTEIAFAAKRHWRYPENWIRQWQEALTITPEYLAENPTFVAAVEDKIVGFGALQIEARDAVLDHLWVLPQFIGTGVGRALFLHAEEIARASGAVRMRIVGDPNAAQFYSRMGATVYGREPASMDGEERFLPLLEKSL